MSLITSADLPPIDHCTALFLDVDGTLLEIARTPDAVRVSAALRETLQRAQQRVNGALALISGRTIASLDRLFAPARFAAAGQHGFERRDAQGWHVVPEVDAQELEYVRQMLHKLKERHANLLIEDKGASLAVHYRTEPRLEPVVHQALNELQGMLAGRYRLRPGKCVVELVPAGIFSKRTAVEAFMHEAPFAGRVPVFVGDDITDEDGFAAVNAMGGHSIKVGRLGQTQAEYCLPDVEAVLAWLGSAVRDTAPLPD